MVTKVARRQAGESRTLNAALGATKATMRSFGKVAHQLWLEVTGAVFLFIAAVGGIALVREYTRYAAGHTTAGRVALAVCFTLTFGWFGVSSFWSIRKNRK